MVFIIYKENKLRRKKITYEKTVNYFVIKELLNLEIS